MRRGWLLPRRVNASTTIPEPAPSRLLCLDCVTPNDEDEFLDKWTHEKQNPLAEQVKDPL
ncbi:hypothetical protein AURDEDRAFT_164123 [Auricularia subglabra TFB-10046 SS5]|nr:hypothetical protein AURDEDRAFT_164123 [Auricularia subglabra TFB-10046 SS5]